MHQQSSKNEHTMVVPLTQSDPVLADEHPASVGGTGERQVLAGRYEILGLLGCGGMGSVYRVRDRELEEIVAVKVLRRELSGAPGVIERFRREVRLSRKVTHPNVARVFDIGEHDGDKFLTMEFVEGESLAALLAREGRLPVDRALEITDAVCSGLGAAHRAGVIHRDLKPDNVLIGKDERVVLTDFGIARALEQRHEPGKTMGAMVGTPAYMAPEQVQGASDIDDRADLYALGAMLYEMLVGEPAWRGDAALAIATARLLSDPPDPRRKRPELPDALARTVLRCMARSRDERFAGVDLVAQELASMTQPAPVITLRPPSSVCAQARPAEPPADKSVAVLPFRNQGSADDAYLAEELTDDLIDTLSMTRSLRMRPRGVVARWKGVDRDPREIGRELDVQVVVEGSVRRRGGAVRISARLISVADGFQLWAKRFDRPEGDVLRVNDEAAQAIAEALTLDWSAPSRKAFSNPVALDLFLRGRHEYRRFWPPHILRALDLFEQALVRSPDDPMILSAYALTRCRLWFFTGKGGDLAEQAARRAVLAAPDLAEGRLAMAAVRLQCFDVVGAAQELKHALLRCSSLAEAQSLLGHVLLEAGAVEEGLKHVKAALAIEPDAPLAVQSLSRVYALLGLWTEVDAAFALHQQSESGSDITVIQSRYAMWRREPEMVAHLTALVSAGPIPATMDLLLLRSTRQGVPFAQAMPDAGAQSSGTTARRRVFVLQIQSEVAGLIGRAEEGVIALQGAVDGGLFDLLWLERCPLLEELRTDPRYPALHAEVKRRADAVLAAYREA